MSSLTYASASLATTAAVTLSSVASGSSRNTNTFTLQVLAAAANPTDTVLVAFTGTASAIICTVTPNDGTNNTLTPVTVTTANLVELINTGLITGKTPTITDASSLRILQTATGGNTVPLADAGEGDGLVGTFASGADYAPGKGIADVKKNATGDYTVTFQDTYNSLKFAKAKLLDSTAADLRFQIASESVSNSSVKTLRFFMLAGSTKTNPASTAKLLIKFDMKNTAGF